MRLNRALVIPALIAAFGAVLIFANLTDRPLWQDEAGTALVSATVLKYGVPKGFDGVNYLSQVRGIEYGRDMMWRWHGWLTFYIEAASLAAFGKTTFAARLPSALFGILNIILLYVLAMRLFRDRATALFAALLLALCVPHILLARQARYLTLEITLTLSALAAYAGEDGLKGWRAAAYFASMFLLVHVIHVVFLPVGAAVLLHAVLFDRAKGKIALFLTAGALAANLPFIFTIYNIGLTQAQPGLKDLSTVPGVLAGYISTFYENAAVPQALLGGLAAAGVWLFHGRKTAGLAGPSAGAAMLPVLVMVLTAVVMSFASSQADYRQIAIALPAAVLLLAAFIGPACRSLPWAGVLCAVLAVSGWNLQGYFYEMTHKFNSGIRAACRYLQENAGKGDIVAVTYGDLPLKFYTGLKVIYPYSGEDTSAVKNAKWVIFRRYTIAAGSMDITKWSEERIKERINRDDFVPVALNAPDLYSENREYMKDHLFRAPDRAPGVVIYKRIR